MSISQTGPASAGMPSDDEAHHGDAIGQLVRIIAILRRRWLVLLATAVLTVAAAAIVVNMLPPRFRATSSVVLHAAGPEVFDKVQGLTEDAEARIAGYREYYQTQRTIMHSRTVAERALAKLGLASDPVFLGVEGIDDPTSRAEAIAEIDPVQRLRELIAIDEVRNSRVVTISAEYPDPIVAADMANAVTQSYLNHVQSGRTDVGALAQIEIEAERAKARDRLQTAEAELEAFKRDNEITSISVSEGQNVITADILTLSTRAKEAEAERIRLQNMLIQTKSLHDKGSIAAASLLPEDRRAVVEELRKQRLEAEAAFRAVDVEYGPKHDEHRKAKARLDLINASIDRESAAMVDSLRSALAAAKQTEKDLQASLGRETGRAKTLGSLERRYRELEREARAAEEEYLLIARRDTEIAITNRVESEGIEILDAATVPTEPVFPRKALFLGLAGIGGLCLGGLLALSIDVRDQRIRGLLDLERGLLGFGIPVLGQLPLLPPDTRLGVGNARAQRRQRDLYAHLFPQSLMAERCRGIRTSIAFVRGSAPAQTIMITSPSSSEGKSSTAINLALSFCQANKRVVLVDADMRRPRIHQVFDEPEANESPGLSRLLIEEITLDDAIVAAPGDAPDNLKLLPCGPLPEHPAELLDTPAFRRMLSELRERFDIVLIDTPPVLPVTDPLVLARHADGVVVVTRCEQTTRTELQRTLSQLVQGDANLLGVVLNEVDARQERYDYGRGYYTYQAQGTGTEAG